MKTKHKFLLRYNQGLLFYLYVYEKLKLPFKIKGDKVEKTYCPFYNDTKASFSIYLNKNGVWCFKDHGNNPEGESISGDVFSFAALYYGIDLKQLPQIIERMDKNLSNFTPSNYTPIKKEVCNSLPKKEMESIRLMSVETSDEVKKYFGQYGIDLNDFPNVSQVIGVEYYKGLFGEVRKRHYDTSSGKIYIAFDFGEYAKIYRPQTIQCPKPKDIWYEVTKPYNYHFGNIDFAEVGAILVIVSGEKDTLTLLSIGIDAICLSSETAKIPNSIKRQIHECCRNAVILYDTDDTGRAEAIKRSKESGYPIADLSLVVPDKFKDKVKDVSDYVKNGLDKKVLIDFLNGFSEVEPYEVSDVLDETIEDGISKDLEDLKDLKDSETNIYKGIDVWVFENLPPFLKNVVKPFEENHERDLVFLSTLPMLSNILPLKGKYMQKTIYPNLFLFIAASASAGKGAMGWAKKLVESIDEGKLAEYLEKKEAYEALDDEGKKKANKPIKQSFLISGNASFAAFAQQLSNNKGIGTIVETEADSINNASKHDWGDYSDIMRKSFEFETISILRKNDDDSFNITTPRLSIVLTGTKNQLSTFINSVENGLFSRFMFFMLPLVKKWKNPFEEAVNLEAHFDDLAKALHNFYFLKRNSKNVKLTKEQQERFNQNLEMYQNQLDFLFGEEIIASVRRLGGIHFRICIILTGVRYYDNFFTAKNVERKHLMCDDIDFEIANRIMIFLIANLKLVYRYLPKPNPVEEVLSQIQLRLFESLNDEFTFSEFKTKSKELDIAFSTAEGFLRKYRKLGLVEKLEHGRYRKIKN